MAAAEPDGAIITAFGGDPELLQPLIGGQGKAWRAGAIVLKPAGNPTTIAWLGEVLAEVHDSALFRLSRPVATLHGEWVLAGWSATQYLPGFSAKGRWDTILDASDALHAALARLAASTPPSTDTPWAHGDRAAWGEEPVPEAVEAVMPQLVPCAAKAWAGAPRQLIHGDLGGNVVFADDRDAPPGIIDMSPYFRPANFAAAVVVVDALAWEEAPLTLALKFATTRHLGDELLARAVIYRLVATHFHFPGNRVRLEAEAAAYSQVLTALHL